MPEGTCPIIDARSLSSSHRRLAELLEPGMVVLDVGCGTGAITRGIAEAVGPHGRVVGVDVNPTLIERACQIHRGVAWLSFTVGDAYALPFRDEFDIATAARVLQWLAEPARALRTMVRASKPGGRVVVLDCNHRKIQWTPQPPKNMLRFYGAFLRWREDAGMDNATADHLEEMFRGAGLQNIAVTAQPEETNRGDPDFEHRIGIWSAVASSRGHQMVEDKVITEELRASAATEYDEWIREEAQRQILYLLAVEGTRPSH